MTNKSLDISLPVLPGTASRSVHGRAAQRSRSYARALTRGVQIPPPPPVLTLDEGELRNVSDAAAEEVRAPDLLSDESREPQIVHCDCHSVGREKALGPSGDRVQQHPAVCEQHSVGR